MTILIKKNIIHIIFFSLIVYSQYYSPVISDDWTHHILNNFNNFTYFERPLSALFIIKIHTLINYDLFYDGFKLFKCFYLFLAYFFLYNFYSIFIDKYFSQLLSFFVIFYPLHDSANFEIWFIGHLLCMTLPLYSYYLFERKHIYSAYIIFGISTFFSYAALPSQVAIIINEYREKNYSRSIKLIILLIIYVLYYFLIIYYINIGLQRIGVGFDKNLSITIKEIISYENILIHGISFIDILIGPSHFIKIFYSIFNNSFFTIILSIFISLYFYHKLKNRNIIKKKYFNKNLIIILYIILFSQLLFILSTKFINIPFGLGNRTNIYISLLVSMLLIWLIKFLNYKYFFIFIFLFFLSFFGTIKYWSLVNNEIKDLRKEVISLSNLNDEKNIFLKNVEYVKFFNFKHIELLNFQNYLNSFLLSHNIDTNNNNFYLLKDINIQNFQNDNNFVIYDFTKKTTVNFYSYKQLTKEYKNYNDYYNYRHWLQYIDFNKLVFLLPDHYKDKFILLIKRD